MGGSLCRLILEVLEEMGQPEELEDPEELEEPGGNLFRPALGELDGLEEPEELEGRVSQKIRQRWRIRKSRGIWKSRKRIDSGSPWKR